MSTISYSGADLTTIANTIKDAVDNIVAQYKVVKATSEATGMGGTAAQLLADAYAETDGIMNELEKKVGELQEEIEAKQASQNATNDAIQEIANRA